MRMKPAVLAVVWSVAAMCVAALGVASAPVRAQVAVPALSSPVVDTTGTLTPPQVAQLERQAMGLQQRTGSQLQILIVPSTQPEDVATYAQRVFETWGLGRKGVDDGVLLLIAKDDRRARIHVGTGLERVVSPDAAGRIIQTALAPRLSAGDFHGGVAEASARLVRRIESGGAVSDPLGGAAWAYIAGGVIVLLIGLICCGLLLYGLMWLMRSGPQAADPQRRRTFLLRATLVEENPDARPRREPHPDDDRDDSRSRSSGSGRSGSGWSGGGGSSRGGGASGGW